MWLRTYNASGFMSVHHLCISPESSQPFRRQINLLAFNRKTPKGKILNAFNIFSCKASPDMWATCILLKEINTENPEQFSSTAQALLSQHTWTVEGWMWGNCHAGTAGSTQICCTSARWEPGSHGTALVVGVSCVKTA